MLNNITEKYYTLTFISIQKRRHNNIDFWLKSYWSYLHQSYYTNGKLVLYHVLHKHWHKWLPDLYSCQLTHYYYQYQKEHKKYQGIWIISKTTKDWFLNFILVLKIFYNMITKIMNSQWNNPGGPNSYYVNLNHGPPVFL